MKQIRPPLLSTDALVVDAASRTLALPHIGERSASFRYHGRRAAIFEERRNRSPQPRRRSEVVRAVPAQAAVVTEEREPRSHTDVDRQECGHAPRSLKQRKQPKHWRNFVSDTSRLLLLLGSVNAGLAVIIGAFGAHALSARVSPDLMSVYHTGSQYHFYHALALLALAALASRVPEMTELRWAGWLFTAGIVLFSGSLYLLAVTGTRWLGAITPIGGLAFIAGWVAVVLGAVRAPR